METLTILTPTRGRPENAHRLIRAFASSRLGDTRLVFGIDEDDDCYDNYMDVFNDATSYLDFVSWITGPRLRMAGTLNAMAIAVVASPSVDAIGFMGDDHLPITRGWDIQYMSTLKKMSTPGIVWGDDLIQGAIIPTQVAMHAGIVRALGRMVPTGMVHLYLDNYWLELGRRLSHIYLPDVVVKHVHPIAGAAQWDQTYVEANDGARAEQDRLFLERFIQDGRLDDDVRRVLAYADMKHA